MFSEQYKKENDKLTLSDEFLNQLKTDMRNEQKRLNSIDSKQAMTMIDTNEDQKLHSNVRKHMLPSMSTAFMAACAGIAILITAPILLSGNTKSDDSCTEGVEEEAANKAECDIEEGISSDSITDSKLTMSGHDTGKTSEDVKADTAENLCTTSMEMYTVGCISFDQPAAFVPTEATLLSQQIAEFRTLQQGADPISLDYACDGRLILHDYYGMIIYDYNKETIERLVDLPSLIGPYTTQGDTTLNVQVYQGGNYVLLNYNSMDESGNPLYYIYDIQTDRIITLTKSEYESLKTPKFESTISGDESEQLTTAETRHQGQSYQAKDGSSITVFYETADDTKISSLCVQIQNGTTSRKLCILKE